MGGNSDTGPTGASPVGQRERVALIDTLRGAALIAMVAYHLVWMLNLFGYTRFELFSNPFWLFARAAILSSFLVISGFVMGLEGIWPRSWRRYYRRLALLAAAAALVTAGTYLTFRDSYIFFGVLHCLTVTAVLALVFRPFPWWGNAIAAAVWLSVIWLPFVPTFDHPWLLWLGLVSRLPITNDYVPIFPWFGVVLAGLALGQSARSSDLWPKLAASFSGPDVLRWPGRHSLPLYLAHPPAILGVLSVVSMVFPPPAPVQDDTSAFLNHCISGCKEIEDSVGQCTTYCGCVLNGLHKAELWNDVRTASGGVDAETQSRLIDITARCSPERLPVPAVRPSPVGNQP